VASPPDDLETEPELVAHPTGPAGAQNLLGLVILWNAGNPEHAGAWLAVGAAEQSKARVLGRGNSRTDDHYARLFPVHQLPGLNQPVARLQNRSLSRVQLRVRCVTNGALAVENVGRCGLWVNGDAVQETLVRAGDVLEIGAQLTLLCTERPFRLGGIPVANHAFGVSDEHGFVGESPAAWWLRSECASMAPRDGHVIVFGATGTGKELVAASLHAMSRRPGPLVARNAATLPESLVDAELFGNVKGYPNPGMPDRSGLVGAADRGTLFLDEFADLPLEAQAHLLRVLDAGEYHRLGEAQARRSHFRLIAATNRAESALRADVLARFDFRIEVPALSGRREDIPLLARHLLHAMSENDPGMRARLFEDGIPRLTPPFVRQLTLRNYPANVRELRHLLWSAVRQSPGDTLEWPRERPGPSGAPSPPSSGAGLEAVGAEELRTALEANNGSIEKSWRALGLSSRYVMMRLLRKHGISVTKQFGKR
jgi:transcriptional regulator with AAA-type ATPase domain